MPRVSVWFIRSSLLSLLLGFTVGAVMLSGKGLGGGGLMAALLPAHIELLLVGWMLQLAMGVAQWILPRFGARGLARGAGAAWVAYGMLNLGVLLVVTAGAASLAHGVLLAGRVAEVAAAAAFLASVWRRVRASGISAM